MIGFGVVIEMFGFDGQSPEEEFPKVLVSERKRTN